jgi:hypothetical protein
MKKSLFVTLGLTAMIALSFAFTRDEPHYKNLKILPKNITKEQMDSVMHHFSLSLGVRCNFCHIHNDDTKTWDFASDENKHKLAARGMMKLTQKINNKYFDVAGTKGLDAKLLVTCYTCHHGSNDPSTKPPMPQFPQQRPPGDSARQRQDTTRRNQ